MKRWRYLICEKPVCFSGRQLFRFVFVGGVGFCVDAGFLMSLMQLGWKIIPARSASFLLAVTCTWILNRLWTFERGRLVAARREYFSYIIVQAIGALINLTLFLVLIKLYLPLQDAPLIPLALGATVSLAFNYSASKKYVFRG